MIAASSFVTNQVHNGTMAGGGGAGTTTSPSSTDVVDNINGGNNQDAAPEDITTTKLHNGITTEDDSSHEDNHHPLVNNDDNQTEQLDGDQQQQQEEEQNSEESVDITISNVVSNFSVRCHLNLRQIACNGSNVVYKREQSIILMKLREPNVTASIWSSGKITCTGATTEESAKCASRRIARCLQKLGFRVRFSSYRIVNVLGACRMPFGIKIHEFSDVHRPLASYEPELHPGATYRIKELKAVLKIFQTGSITITAPSIQNVELAVQHIYPLVYEFRKPKPGTLHHQQFMESQMMDDERTAVDDEEIFGLNDDSDD